MQLKKIRILQHVPYYCNLFYLVLTVQYIVAKWTVAALIAYGLTSSGMTSALYGINRDSGVVNRLVSDILLQCQYVVIFIVISHSFSHPNFLFLLLKYIERTLLIYSNLKLCWQFMKMLVKVFMLNLLVFHLLQWKSFRQ